MSTMRSARIAGPSTTRPPSGACGATGCPSSAITTGSMPREIEAEDAGVGGVDQPQADALALPDRETSGTRPLMVTVLPTRPL